MSFIAMLMAMAFLVDGSSGSKSLEGFMLEKSGSVAQSSGMQTGWMKSWLTSSLGLQSLCSYIPHCAIDTGNWEVYVQNSVI